MLPEEKGCRGFVTTSQRCGIVFHKGYIGTKGEACRPLPAANCFVGGWQQLRRQ